MAEILPPGPDQKIDRAAVQIGGVGHVVRVARIAPAHAPDAPDAHNVLAGAAHANAHDHAHHHRRNDTLAVALRAFC